MTIILNLLVLHLVNLNVISLLPVYNFIKAFPLHLYLIDLGPVSLKDTLVTRSNVLLLLGSLVIELRSAVVLNPLPGQVHGVAHVDLIFFHLVHFLHETLLTSKVLDSLVRSFLLFFQLHDSCLQKLLMGLHLLLLVNSFHHVCLSLRSYN